jgi:HD-GYP domain-containing protein (c-di-GMP phosphodiesterase class II)
VADEGFVSYFAVPLIAKGEVKGVLEIFHRSLLNPSLAWLNFLDSLSWQTAIAIDSALLFEDLQRSNTNLLMSYDKTIEGWSRALDLRDKETEGHTERVTKATIELAKIMGIPDEQVVHIWRGSMLHDIGKMGVPDGILLKPGELTDEEWVLMRKHPQFAYEMLKPINYLHHALNIPYYHHEKWDGSGYPHGLKGELIPLEARIFAVVDVWDALSNDRPYRSAWPREKVIHYIKEESGKHFDQQVVNKFLALESQWHNNGR